MSLERMSLERLSDRRGPCPRHLVVTGPMGAGKTTTGRRLAAELGRPLFDSDLQLQERFGKTGEALASEKGVAWLHRAEAEALEEALASDHPAVIAAAASVADLPEIATLLGRDDVMTVVLTAEPEVLASRSARGTHRRRVDLEAHFETTRRRAGRLSEVADVVVDVTHSSPDAVVSKVLAACRQPSAATSEKE